MMRQCGDCQLCCKLLPVPPLDKKAGERCQHQKFGKGCAVHNTRKMPKECRLWNCRWLVNNDTADLSRPDRSHYVIDVMPDFVTVVDNATGAKHNIPVVQIWCDPKHADAHRDPALRAYLLRRAEEGIVGIVRFNNRDALTIIPPSMSSDHQWHERASGVREKQHTLLDIMRALGENEEL